MDYWENDNDTVEIITNSKNEPCNLHLISFLTNLFDNKMAILKVITWALNIYIYISDNFFVPYLLQQHGRYPEKEYKLLKKLNFWKKNSCYLLHDYNVPETVLSTLHTSHLTKFT